MKAGGSESSTRAVESVGKAGVKKPPEVEYRSRNEESLYWVVIFLKYGVFVRLCVIGSLT